MAQHAEATRPVRKGKRVSPTRHFGGDHANFNMASQIPFLGGVLPLSSLVRYFIRIVSIWSLATVTRTWPSTLELVTFPV